MEHTQKMYLVPQHQIESLKQLHQQPHQPSHTPNVSLRQSSLNALDQAMSDILKQPDINVYEKAKKYSSILQRYLAMVKQDEREKTVITLSLPENDSKDEIAENDIIRTEVLKHMPKRNKRNAEYIMDALARNNNQISWTDQGEIVVENKNVTGSHLYDLLKSVTTHNNVLDSSRPTGWNVFLKTLANLNVPLSAIPNTSVHRAIAAFKTGVPVVNIRQPSLTDSHSSLTPRSLRFASPITTSKWASF